MVRVGNLLVGFIAATALFSGSVAADTKAEPRTNPASRSTGYGVIEAIEPDPARSEGPDAAVADPAGGAAAGQEVEKSGRTKARFVIRVRLDDGRYQGFHQYGGDELRVGDRVQTEIDRLHRVQEQGQAGK